MSLDDCFVRHDGVEHARILDTAQHESSAVPADRRRIDDQRLFRQRMRILVFG